MKVIYPKDLIFYKEQEVKDEDMEPFVEEYFRLMALLLIQYKEIG